ncbi:hypothetical protein CFE70_000490 [Pyrenophora teres f. teres 0-1]
MHTGPSKPSTVDVDDGRIWSLSQMAKESQTNALWLPPKRSCLLEWNAAASQGLPLSAIGLSAVLPILNALPPTFILSSSPVIHTGPVLVDACTDLVQPPWSMDMSPLEHGGLGLHPFQPVASAAPCA